MLLNKGVIRVGLPIPQSAEFELIAVDDPYHFASAAELSLFRRPLPGTNVRFVSAVMWDGRENTGSDHGYAHPQVKPQTAGSRCHSGPCSGF